MPNRAKEVADMIAAELEAKSDKDDHKTPAVAVAEVTVPEEPPVSSRATVDSRDILETVDILHKADPRSEDADAEPTSEAPPTKPDPTKKAQRDLILAAFLAEGQEPDSARHKAVTAPPPADYKPTKL
jgi:hypothetical protein